MEDTKVHSILYNIADPEIPVLSIMDMGVVRDIIQDGKSVLVKITPTYSGCPAMDMIATEIKYALEQVDYKATVELVLDPAWTTDMINEEGRRKLQEYGIATPLEESADKRALMGETALVTCPQCGSKNTEMISPFGSTACKALFKCKDCLEPFDYFKCLK